MENKACEQGWNGLVWTDPFHPGFESTSRMKQPSGALDRITDYLRTEDFQTGEVAVRWSDADGSWQRRLFVSRPDSAIVLSITGLGKGKLNCELAMPPMPHKLILSEPRTEPGWITAHNTYVKGKGGYDSVLRVVNRGGHITSDGQKVVVTEADEVLVLGRIEPWTTPLPDSEAWAYSPKNPEFARGVKTNHIADLRNALASLPADYANLFKSHAKAHGDIFNRVKLDLAGGADRRLTTDELLASAQAQKRLSPALLQKMYDAGRYMFIGSAGELVPNLQGIWTGSWQPAWSGDFTTDANIQCAIAPGLSGNMFEGMEA